MSAVNSNEGHEGCDSKWKSELSKVELKTLEKSLEVIKAQKLSYIKQGLNPVIIYLGIMNIALTGLIVGRIPEYYWIY